MNIPSTVRSWVRATDARIRVTRLQQDHTLDVRYPDVVPTVHLKLTLQVGESGRRPQLRIWIPLARRTPLFVFGPDAAQPAEVDVEATFPSFENEGQLVAALDKVRSDFLAHYRATRSSGHSRLRQGRLRKPRCSSPDTRRNPRGQTMTRCGVDAER